MWEKRVGVALLAALAMLYIHYLVPTLYKTAAPALREALGLDQIALPISEEVRTWIEWR